jgi:hypothetical protein
MPTLAPPIGIRCRAKRRRSIVNVQHPHARVLLSVGAFAKSWLHLTGHELHTR